MGIVRIIAIILVGCLLLLSLYRLTHTSKEHPDFRVRLEMTRLMAVILVGQFADLLRTRFVEGTPAFLAISVMLFPVLFLACFLLWRIYRAYRTQKS